MSCASPSPLRLSRPHIRQCIATYREPVRKEAAEWPASPAGPACAASVASAECGAVDLIGTLWATRIGPDSGGGGLWRATWASVSAHRDRLSHRLLYHRLSLIGGRWGARDTTVWGHIREGHSSRSDPTGRAIPETGGSPKRSPDTSQRPHYHTSHYLSHAFPRQTNHQQRKPTRPPTTTTAATEMPAIAPVERPLLFALDDAHVFAWLSRV